MKIIEKGFVPILMGNDINSYSMARAFHEEYQVKSIVIGKFQSGPNNNSKICELIVVKNIDNDDIIFKQTMEMIAKKYANKKLLLIGCGDSYVNLIIKNKNNLNRSFVIPYIDQDLMDRLINKEKFYKMCDAYGINYPKTLIINKNGVQDITLPFGFPVILKPSSGVEYWKHPFVGQDKVFKIKDHETLVAIIKKVFDSGYSESLVIQDFIPGDDSFMKVLTCYSNKLGQVKLMSLGHVLLEEHTPHGLGNHAAILNDYDEPLMQNIKMFLEKIGYIGFSNFDIKYDIRDGKYKVFEINLRQGRSNFYVTGAGYNLAKFVVEDYIENKTLPLKMVKERKLWLVIPKQVILKYTKSDELKNEMRMLMKNRQTINPLFYKGDLGMKRMLFLIKSHLSHFAKYRKYYN